MEYMYHGTLLKTKVEEPFFDSPKNLSLNVFLKKNNHPFLRMKNSLIIQGALFHYKELFVIFKCVFDKERYHHIT